MTTPTAPSAPTVAVIGGGFSGLLTAIHLLHGDPDIVVRLVEKAPQFGRGRAFDAREPDQLLKIRFREGVSIRARPSALSHARRAPEHAGPEGDVASAMR